jgi:hypothetical protein
MQQANLGVQAVLAKGCAHRRVTDVFRPHPRRYCLHLRCAERLQKLSLGWSLIHTWHRYSQGVEYRCDADQACCAAGIAGLGAAGV